MELKEIAAISGKEGLFKVLKPARNGVIVETLDAQKKKMAVGAAGKVSILKEISIYTTTKEGSIALQDVLIAIHEKYQGSLPIDSKASTADLMEFIAEVLPEFDSEKVYPSDVKKLVKWYSILHTQAPEVLVKQEEKSEETNTIQEAKTEETTEEKPKKSRAKATKKEETETKVEVKTEEVTEEKPKKSRAKATKKEEAETKVEAKTEETTEEKPKKSRAKKQS